MDNINNTASSDGGEGGGASLGSLLIGGAVLAGTGAALYFVRKWWLAKQPHFVPYPPSTEPGVMRFWGFLKDVRFYQLQDHFNLKLWTRMLEEANQADDYAMYLQILQDMFLYADNSDNTLILERMKEVIYIRVYDPTTHTFNLNAPEIIDYVKLLCLHLMEMGESLLGKQLMDLDYCILEKRRNASTKQEVQHLPRLPYGLLTLNCLKFMEQQDSRSSEDSVELAAQILSLEMDIKDAIDDLPDDLNLLTEDEMSFLVHFVEGNNGNLPIYKLEQKVVILAHQGSMKSDSGLLWRYGLFHAYCTGGHSLATPFMHDLIADLDEVCMPMNELTALPDERKFIGYLMTCTFGLQILATRHNLQDSLAFADNLLVQLQARYPQAHASAVFHNSNP